MHWREWDFNQKTSWDFKQYQYGPNFIMNHVSQSSNKRGKGEIYIQTNSTASF